MSNQIMFTVSSEVFKTVKPNYFSMQVVINVTEKSSKEEANKEMQKLVAEANKVLDKYKDDLNKVTTSYHSSSYKVKKKDQFYMQYYISFESESMDKVKEIYDSMSGLDNTSVRPPVFGIRNVGFVEKDLLKLAFEKAKEQAKMECEVFGVNFDELKICTWNNQFYHREDAELELEVGGTRAFAAVASVQMNSSEREDNLKLEPSDKKVRLRLQVSYGK